MGGQHQGREIMTRSLRYVALTIWGRACCTRRGLRKMIVPGLFLGAGSTCGKDSPHNLHFGGVRPRYAIPRENEKERRMGSKVSEDGGDESVVFVRCWGSKAKNTLSRLEGSFTTRDQ